MHACSAFICFYFIQKQRYKLYYATLIIVSEIRSQRAHYTLVDVNAPVFATTSWWWKFSALVLTIKVKKSIPVDFMIYL